MLENIFIQNSFIALILGFIIGLQREMRSFYIKSSDFGGGRTFAIISFSGYLSAFLSSYSPYFLPAAFMAIALLLIAAYVANSRKEEKQRGATTEFSALSAFLLGALLNFLSSTFVIFCAIVLLLLLNLKDKIQELEKYIGKTDVNGAILFLTMTFVVLPILPNKTVDSFSLFNPYNIWLMVVLIAGISFAGYIAVRIFGTGKGIVLTGLLGGLISSTAVTLSLSRKASEEAGISRKVAVGIMFASTIMFARALLLVFLFNSTLAQKLFIPLSVSLLVSLGVSIFYYYKSKNDDFTGGHIEYKNPFELKEAVVLGIFFGIVVALVKLSKQYIGDSGIYLVSLISGITDVDPIILSLSDVAGNGIIYRVAAVGIAIAIVMNSISKLSICFAIGRKELAVRVLGYYILSCLPLFLVAFIS